MFPKNPSDPSNSVEPCNFLARHVPDCRCCMLALFLPIDFAVYALLYPCRVIHVCLDLLRTLNGVIYYL